MSDQFGRRTIFSPPFEVPRSVVVEPVFEAPWGPGPRLSDKVQRNIVNGSVVVSLDPDIITTPSLERIAEIADNYPTSTAG